MTYKYFYIDDNMNDTVDGIIQALNGDTELKIEALKSLTDWEKQWEVLNKISFDGLILDLRLCDATDDEGKRAEFNGATLAQEIRSRQREGKLKSFPIVLLSANENLESLLNSISVELFDFIQPKSTIDYSNLPKILISLCTGYQLIRSKSFDKIIGIESDKFFNRSFKDEFIELQKKPVYEISSFIINHLILRRGLLIEKEILLARLGVDKNSEDIELLLQSLNDIKYKGAFADGWERWWMPLLEDWWNNKISLNDYFRFLTANRRVELLKMKLGLKNLQPIVKISDAVSEAFGTICKGTGSAIDTIDGIVLDDQNLPYNWQEKEYVSVQEALDEEHRGVKWKNIASFEKEKLQKIKTLKSQDQRRKRK